MLGMYKIPCRLRMMMLEYLIAISLILLTFGHALLIRGCFDINKKLLPLNGQAGTITEQVGGIGTLMDELCDLISDLADSGGPAPSKSAPNMQDLLGGLITSTIMGNVNGPQNQDRTIQETHDTQTQESSAENI
jgi:hypothetical protein